MAQKPDVTVRPATADDVAFVDRVQTEEVAGPFNWFGGEPPAVDGDPPRREDATGAAGTTDGVMIVEADGQGVGTMSSHLVQYGPNEESRAHNIGITLLPEARGRGVGSTAQRLYADLLLAASPFPRVEASTDVENVAEQRALERAGFTREGVLRAAQYRDGTYHDLVLYSRVRADTT